MLDINRFSEHNRIDQYLKRRSWQILQSKRVINHEDKLSNFPIGLIIIVKDESSKDKIELINHYACELFQMKDGSNIIELKAKLDEYIRLKNNNTQKSDKTLKDLIFNSSPSSFEINNFFPFQCKHSQSLILYIKINYIENQKYIVIDKYDKYLEEQKYIEFNLIKNINYQYLHTLYHELNNPLNALLAISGEKMKFDSTELRYSKIFTKSQLNKKKTMKQKVYKKERTSGFISLNNSKSKIISNNQDEQKPIRKSLFENNNSSDISGKINLLVKIIKIFIKNFILYLKTRADNLLTLQNEFNIQNETSDIMNAVEVSDYEKDLTKHKNVKINLEYIFDLYFNKYHCLFKYKEIDCETNFTQLKNIYVITDDFYFSYYIRQIYTYLYYVVPKKEGFYFIYNKKDNKKITIIIKKKINANSSKITEEPRDFAMSQLIQTKEMTKEVLYSMSKKLKFVLEIFDNENSINNNEQNNNYLSITIPIIKKDKTTEDDEFKENDINEMVEKNNSLLEEKLKRQLSSSGFIIEHKNSNISTINVVDMISKNEDDKKEITDSLISFPKNINFKSDNNLINNNNLHLFQKNKFMSFNSSPSNDSFLSKCLKISENKKSEKEKSKFRKEHLNINFIQNKINNHSSNKNIFINITNINNASNNNNNNKYEKKKSYASLKRIINKNSEKCLKSLKSEKSQQLKGIFTYINKYGYSESLDNCDKYISKISKKNIKLKKNEITFKEQSPNSSSKNMPKLIKNNISKITVDQRNSGPHNSLSIATAFFGKKNPSKSNYKSSFFISDIGENENNKFNKKKNSSKHRIKIEYIKEENIIKNTENSNNNYLKLSEIEKKSKKRNSHNNNSSKSKDCMTFFIDNKKLSISNNTNNNTTNNTIIDDNFNENKNLFLEANKERNFYLQKSKKKNNINFNSQSDIVRKSENYEECEENEELEEDEESYIESKDECKCVDLLVVDDEEFNVMASQKMLKNLGFESDKAYNGEECIKLIKSKKELNCKCERNYYKIIFLDIVMPVMDGIKAAKTIQEMINNKEINENVKIVFISGNIDGADLKKSLLAINCVKECLQKPVQISKYQKILEKYYN